MKKVLSLVLVAVLAIGMSVTAFADQTKVDAHGSAKLGDIAQSDVKGLPSGVIFGADTNLNTVDPADELEIVIPLNKTANLFVYEDGVAIPIASLNRNLFSKGKVTVKIRYSKGGRDVIDSVSLDRSDMELTITFKDEYVSTKELDFDFNVYLAFNGKGEADDGITFTGTFENDTINVDADTTNAFLGDKVIVEPEENVRNITLDLGSNVTMEGMRLTKDKKYYGTATTTTTDEQQDLVDEYGFKEAYTLKTVGLSTTGNYVRLGDLGRSDYVYGYENGAFTFVGMGNELLPYYSEYYVSSTELQGVGAGDDTTPEEPAPADDDILEPGDDPEPAVPGGGDDVASDNINFNPGTGA